MSFTNAVKETMRGFDRNKKWILICENQQVQGSQRKVTLKNLGSGVDFYRMIEAVMLRCGRADWSKNLIIAMYLRN
jgi:hypothetical protein